LKVEDSKKDLKKDSKMSNKASKGKLATIEKMEEIIQESFEN